MKTFSSGIEATKLTIASRKSRLAICQAEYVRDSLRKLYPACNVSILGVKTHGDQILDFLPYKVGGKGLFIKELELSLFEGRADLAVHSLKDMPMVLPNGLSLAAVMAREDPRDAFVSRNYPSLDGLPIGAIVGTSSIRREAMLRARYPYLKVKPLRGNLDTRLAKLDRCDYDAVILAAAGLKRLKLDARIQSLIEIDISIPASGQGALGIEIASCRSDVARLLAPLHDRETALAVEAERMVLRRLDCNCEVPLAAHATWCVGELYLIGRISTLDGVRVLTATASAPVISVSDALLLGEKVADELKHRGALDIISTLKNGIITTNNRYRNDFCLS